MKFGSDVNYDDFIRESLTYTGKLGKDYITNKQILMELYETSYGVFDHVNGRGSLDSVRFNPSEDTVNHYLYDSYLELFMYKAVNKHTGLSFDEFLDKPRYEIEKILKVVDTFREKESKAGEAALSKIQTVNKQ